MAKIKRKKRNFVIGYLLFVIGLLIYTRFVNLGWGFPYPMHPDERNMAAAIQSLNCELKSWQVEELKSCLNPHFFAYGQLPLYLAYFGIGIWKWIMGLSGPISFIEATAALRIISAAAAIANVWVMLKIAMLIKSKIKDPASPKLQRGEQNCDFAVCSLIFTFVPYAIQSAHFGTTESLLMLFYSLIVYYSVLILQTRTPSSKFLILNSIFSGMAVATKISAAVFIALPLVALLFTRSGRLEKLYLATKLILLTILVAVVLSPFNLIDYRDFLASINYETAVATGSYAAFYTRQFIDTIPVWFQMTKIIPYALGWPLFLLFLAGFLLLPWRRDINFLRLSLMIVFLPNAFLFAKWTRFMAPVFPIMVIFATSFLLEIKVINITKTIIIIAAILPGVAYLSVYKSEDVRLQASDWIFNNIPAGSKVLSETANVVDIPLVSNKNYKNYKSYMINSFNFYNLDENPVLQTELGHFLSDADYIFVPSRRIWANYTCIKDQKSKIPTSLRQNVRATLGASNMQSDSAKCKMFNMQYPQVNKYYEKLFNRELGFRLIKEFSSYPQISLFGKTIWENKDEAAEETWSVFDHPVIRIYKRS